jgi:predicted N-acyltransferase
MHELSDLSLVHLPALSHIPAAAWDQLVGPDSPMLNHAWLDALEETDCVGGRTGWLPKHIAVFHGDRLVAAMPVYLKSHSMGELLYDFSWASSLEAQGYPYYPKLIVANPFTPITSAKFLTHPELTEAETDLCQRKLFIGLHEALEQTGARSLHLHFLPEQEVAIAKRFGFTHHLSAQYHWMRGEAQTFEDFLGTVRSKTRREIRRERKNLKARGYTVEAMEGTDVSDELICRIYDFYIATYAKFGWGAGHLNLAFFRRIREQMPQHLKLFLAYDPDKKLIGGTFNLQSGRALYGRYWGATEEVPFLHFETCLYTMIEHALANGYDRIEPGQGGEHKLARGYQPREMHSAHWFRHPHVQAAMDRALGRARESHLEVMHEMRQMSHITAFAAETSSSDDD